MGASQIFLYLVICTHLADCTVLQQRCENLPFFSHIHIVPYYEESLKILCTKLLPTELTWCEFHSVCTNTQENEPFPLLDVRVLLVSFPFDLCTTGQK